MRAHDGHVSRVCSVVSIALVGVLTKGELRPGMMMLVVVDGFFYVNIVGFLSVVVTYL